MFRVYPSVGYGWVVAYRFLKFYHPRKADYITNNYFPFNMSFIYPTKYIFARKLQFFVSVGTESIDANTTTKHETPNDDRTTPSGLIVSPSAPGGFATTSNTAFTPVVSGGGVVMVQPPVSSDGVVMVQPKKMWQCKVEAENNSHQSVIGEY